MKNKDENSSVQLSTTAATVNIETDIKGNLRITVPLTINITNDETTTSQKASNFEALSQNGESPKESTETPLEATKKSKTSLMLQDIDSLEGYNDNFIDPNGKVVVPMPSLTLAGQKKAAPVVDGGVELKYNKFSIVMHAERRLALFTIANIDWRESSRSIDGIIPNRKTLLNSSPWTTDPRLVHEHAHQLHNTFYKKDRGAFERGHLVHRASVCWGQNLEDIKTANRNTYFMTNCTPQIEAFNQSTDAVDNWGDHEIMIAKQSSSEKIVVVAGPVLAADDPKFMGIDKTGSTTVQIPRKYWKIVVSMGVNGPETFGFLLEQHLPDSTFEFVVPARWKMFQTSIEEIEKHLFGTVKLTWYKQYDQHSDSEFSPLESVSFTSESSENAHDDPSRNEIAYPNLEASITETAVGYIHGINFDNQKVTFDIINNRCIFEGDIDLGDLSNILAKPEYGLESIAIVCDRFRWTNGTIPYTIDSSIKNIEDIRTAITHWEKHTPIKLVARDNQTDYVTFRSGQGCKSSVGKQSGQQFITLSRSCTTGNIIHEIGHTVGLWHEHTRSDRDDYITINDKNIQKGKKHNFSKRLTDGIEIGKYDCASIMHYGEFAFALNDRKPSITTQKGVKIGQRDGLSEKDIAAVEQLYTVKHI